MSEHSAISALFTVDNGKGDYNHVNGPCKTRINFVTCWLSIIFS